MPSQIEKQRSFSYSAQNVVALTIPFAFLFFNSSPLSAEVYYVPDTSPSYSETYASENMKYICKQLNRWQTQIEAYISTHHNGNAALFSPAEAILPISHFSAILGATPTIYTTGTSNNCPNIKIQLGTNHTAETGHLILPLDSVKFRSQATCVAGSIVKWTTYTNLSYVTLQRTMGLNACYNLQYLDTVDLS
jgi:hypothetical protein